ncbi:uncharacterized protein AMSG_05133 [Thecamonas trahens ATCC 50062]|uniref:Uncharacterized protein n=1 Tax=Thecamonas trahens ATCC 50062 TaxID=461836 RepID=A0A0L0DAQ1_THETB|nr:hypothetical protein AMSG_05133 [Thecamonas trahens ATCC 50062]KNC49156.1 hypothetical protein AMSG_05133 [Thecamonas trahens ATCC 50062]|eukprot:XP_013758178.1 hypothetical protein AMSG_05133 [Thecamonas trahens ATCC 50062]
MAAPSDTPTLFTYSGTLRVVVVSGTGLLAQDANGLSDPYVKVTALPPTPVASSAKAAKAKAADAIFKTPVIKKTLEPRWDAEGSIALAHAGRVHFEVKDDDKFGHNDPMGEAVLPLLALAHGRKVTKVLRLVPGAATDLPPRLGSITVSLQLESAADLTPVYDLDLVDALGNDMELAVEHGLPLPIDGAAATEGIFRVPGNADHILRLKEAANFGKLPEILTEPASDVASVAGAFKLWFRELLVPLVPASYYDAALAATDPPTARALVDSLPEANQNIIEFLARFLYTFTSDPASVEATKMDAKNMAMTRPPSASSRLAPLAAFGPPSP